jgi:hypothetical protein
MFRLRVVSPAANLATGGESEETANANAAPFVFRLLKEGAENAAFNF